MTEPIRGVGLQQYATIVAGRADALPLADLLAVAGVPADVWPQAEEAWGERLIGDLEADGSLAGELERAQSEARRRWARPLPPLDQNLRAWLDFERAWAAVEDGEAHLAGFGMHLADITRLQELWGERLHGDADLQREALVILADEPGEPPVPAPEPARFIAERRSA
jgi:hypothetical protein